MSALMPLVLFCTVVASVSFGIFAAYAAVIGVFAAFGHPAHATAEPVRPRLVLVPSQTHASGD